MSVSDELQKKLGKRIDIEEGSVAPPTENPDSTKSTVFNPYTEFKEFSRQQIKDFEKMFKIYDVNNDKFLDLHEIKLMMEKLGAPQTHIGLKTMIKEVDEDHDNQICFREFLLIFRKSAAGELDADSGLGQFAKLSEIDVDQTGVLGARDFFQAKADNLAVGKKFEAEIRQEQEQRRVEEVEKSQRRAAFKEKASLFTSQD